MNHDPEKTMDAVWCRDSETSEYVLVDRFTNEEIIRQKENPNAS